MKLQSIDWGKDLTENKFIDYVNNIQKSAIKKSKHKIGNRHFASELVHRRNSEAQRGPRGEWSSTQGSSPISRPSVPAKAPGPSPICLRIFSQPVGKLPSDRLLQHPNPVSRMPHFVPKPSYHPLPHKNSEAQAATAQRGPRGKWSLTKLDTPLSRPSVLEQNSRPLPHLPHLSRQPASKYPASRLLHNPTPSIVPCKLQVPLCLQPPPAPDPRTSEELWSTGYNWVE